jgi:hypothetical protein
MTSRQEIFLPANRPETDRITVSPLVTEIIQESSLHPDCGKNSPVKNRLESTGNLPTLLEVWGQSLQQIDDQLRTLTEEGTVRFNYHSVREIKEKVNNNFVQKGDNQEGQDDFLPEAALGQFLQARPYLDGRTGGTVLRCFRWSVDRLIKARAAGAKKSLAEIKKTADGWGMLPGGSNGRSTRPKHSGDFHRS